MNRPYDILVAGEINPDLILSDPDLKPRFGQHETLVENATLAVGSSAAIFACGAARLGLEVGFIGVVGDDLFGQFMLDALVERGVDVSNVIVDSQTPTGISVILSRGTDRAIITHMGTIDALRTEHIPDALLGQARHLHVTSYFLQTALQPDLPDLFCRSRTLGLSTSLDTNWDPDQRWAGVETLLKHTTVFLSNEVEALSLSGASTLLAAVRRLALAAGTVAIKQGSDGAIACRGNAIVRAPALPVVVTDTVGAGDSFDAGFLYGVLAGWDLERSLKLGAVCGSLSTRKHGGVAAQPTLDEALAAMQESRQFQGSGN
ncbi:MAG: carbohydrate kinase family protein [Chloroflexi bacterium]|nr:carbohydrate kinase family protein [Chloroflexota bacterium]